MYMTLQVIYKSRAFQIPGATTGQESFSLEGMLKIVLKHPPVFECVIYLMFWQHVLQDMLMVKLGTTTLVEQDFHISHEQIDQNTYKCSSFPLISR